MEQHVKIVAILNIVLGALGLCIALVILVFFGGLAGVVIADEDPDAEQGAAVLGLIGTIGFFVVAVFSIPGLIGGIGLLKFRSWAQTLTIIVSVLNLLSIPFGTVVGVYGLWVLLNKETMALIKANNIG